LTDNQSESDHEHGDEDEQLSWQMSHVDRQRARHSPCFATNLSVTHSRSNRAAYFLVTATIDDKVRKRKKQRTVRSAARRPEQSRTIDGERDVMSVQDHVHIICLSIDIAKCSTTDVSRRVTSENTLYLKGPIRQ
jgi:hypothetical protein